MAAAGNFISAQSATLSHAPRRARVPLALSSAALSVGFFCSATSFTGTLVFRGAIIVPACELSASTAEAPPDALKMQCASQSAHPVQHVLAVPSPQRDATVTLHNQSAPRTSTGNTYAVLLIDYP